MKNTTPSHNEAAALALKAIEFLCADQSRMARFLSLTGIEPGDLRTQVTRPEFQGGILDYILQDESLLFELSEFSQIPVKMVKSARLQLP